jgi:hypothetical protein
VSLAGAASGTRAASGITAAIAAATLALTDSARAAPFWDGRRGGALRAPFGGAGSARGSSTNSTRTGSARGTGVAQAEPKRGKVPSRIDREHPTRHL